MEVTKSDTKDKLKAEPKDKSVLLIVWNTDHELRVTEHVGGNVLAGLISSNPHDMFEKHNDALVNPLGQDAYVVTKDNLETVKGTLNNLDASETDSLLDSISESDKITLTILH